MPDAQLFLVDAHALCYRAYFAIKGLSTSRGQTTNAVYGFVNTLRKILREYHPRYMAVCFDVGARTHRQAKFMEYKIQRPPMPDDLVRQIGIIKEVVRAYRLPVFEKEGFEADDIIATIVRKTSEEVEETVIVSDDKDMFQLVNEKVKIFSTRKDKILGQEDVREFLGVEPRYIPDYIGLAGDAVDNIPGVEGVGDVSARNLINRYGPLENILGSVEQIQPQRLRERLLEHRDTAVLSKELACLESDVPGDFQLKDMQVQEPDGEKLFALFNDLEFRNLAAEFVREGNANIPATVTTVADEKAVDELCDAVTRKGQWAVMLDAAPPEDLAFGGRNCTAALDAAAVYRIAEEWAPRFQKIFDDPKVLTVTYDLKTQEKLLADYQCRLGPRAFDCLLAGYLLSSSRSGYDLRTLAWQHLKIALPENFSSQNAVPVLLPLYTLLHAELQEKELLPLLRDIEAPLACVLALMEREGVKIDEPLLRDLSQTCGKKIESVLRDVVQMAGEEFNVNSPKQLSHILFEKLKLPVVKKTKTGFSTDEEVLTKLAAQHALPAMVLEYRQLAKLKSTYIDALPGMVNLKTGKVHASFNQTGTETGRLSSSNPNLQNIPIRTELGRQIRKAFIPSQSDHVLISADYSQIELRVLAHLSQDENLTEAFHRGEDVHNFTAALVFDIKEADVLPEMRNMAKRVNFGIIYGMSAFGLAKDLAIPVPQAQDFIDRYFLRYPGVKIFMDQTIKTCEEKGYVVTLCNRRRYIPEIHSRDMAVRQFAQRQAINTPVQGSAADLMKLAMVNVQKELDRQGLRSRMVITVHDELVFDVPVPEVARMQKLIREHMEQTFQLSVPIKVSMKQGKNWLEMEKVVSRQ